MADDQIWFIIKGHQEDGPFSPGQLQSMLQSRQITNAQVLRRKGELEHTTAGKALALKKQLQKNQNQAAAVQKSAMEAMVKSTAFRAFLLFILLLAVAIAGLYFSGKYQEEPFAEYFRMAGLL
ncbi:MAG: DUF4339 domain-containing protein [Planctomycetes bacterium]|nr:DUF4339 domain-containing protein [Planctomycetota bacterium]